MTMAAITSDAQASQPGPASSGPDADQPRPAVGGPARRGTRMWDLLALPGAIWMSVFFIASLALVAALSFGTTSDLGDTYFGHTLVNIEALADPAYRIVLVRSREYAVLTAVICLVIAYPVAYAIALHAGKYKNALIALIVVPFFANYLVRMYGWSSILSDQGPVLTFLRKLGVPQSFHIINTGPGVIAGLVYGFAVFMVLPLYAAMERMDTSLIEAGRDLYGGPLRTFLTVTVPATRQGALAGMVLVFLPAMGDFVSAQFLGGPNQIMIGNLIQEQFYGGQDWPQGDALTMLLMAVLLVGMAGYLRRARKDEAEAVR
jgi:spermidine/putrescine transport system permease protein